MSEVINIVLSADQAAIEQSATVVSSVVSRTRRHVHVRCYVRAVQMESFEEGRLKVDFIPSEQIFTRNSLPAHVGEACFDRLQIIKDAVDWDKCILLDYDQIAKSDISEMYDVDIQNCYLAARLGGSIEQMTKAWNFGCLPEDVPQDIRCAPWPWLGCVMNLKKMREDGIWDRLITIHDKWPMTEQVALALATANQVGKLDSEWNYCPNLDPPIELPKIIHWTSPSKPWIGSASWRPEIWKNEACSWRRLKESMQKGYRQGGRTSIAAEPPSLSVCVSLKNRSRVPHKDSSLSLFPNLVESIVKAFSEFKSIELIVADYMSDDFPLGEWFEEAIQDVPWKLLNLSGSFSRGGGLNEAVKYASSENIFICDADITVTAAALTYGLSILERGAVAFPMVTLLDEFGGAVGVTDGYGICFVTKNLFKACGGVPPFESWGGEDNLFYQRVSQMSTVVREVCGELRHQWHPDEYRYKYYSNERVSDYNHYVANPENQLAKYPYVFDELSGEYRIFIGSHPCWSGPLYLYADHTLIRPNVDSGVYELVEKERISLCWDEWPTEILNWSEKAGAYLSEDKNFSIREIV